MAVVVVGGHSRNVGKTSVVAGIIAALTERRWTAMKITQFGHGVCSRNGKRCNCATADHSWAISEETDAAGKSDTARFLAAGAERVYWVRTQQGHLDQAMPALSRRVQEAENVILESNSVIKFMEPDIYLTVLDPSTADFKASAQRYLERADAVIMQSSPAEALWPEPVAQVIGKKTAFVVQPPTYLNPQIIDYLRTRLNSQK